MFSILFRMSLYILFLMTSITCSYAESCSTNPVYTRTSDNQSAAVSSTIICPGGKLTLSFKFYRDLAHYYANCTLIQPQSTQKISIKLGANLNPMDFSEPVRFNNGIAAISLYGDTGTGNANFIDIINNSNSNLQVSCREVSINSK